jgi:predicted nucleic acid-binding protein
LPALYVDTSALLRATLETGTTREVEARLESAPILLTSRLTLVEAARAMIRVRQLGRVSESRIVDVERELERLWARCELWELTPAVCEMARHVAPGRILRALDALHLATFLLARRRIEGLTLLTVDDRLREAVGEA